MQMEPSVLYFEKNTMNTTTNTWSFFKATSAWSDIIKTLRDYL